MINKSFKENFIQLFYVIVITWVIFLLSTILPLNKLGIYPRYSMGLFGIVLHPFLHGSFSHILSNTLGFLPFVFIFTLLEREDTFKKIIYIVLMNGVLIWLFARSSYHIGASGLIFGLYGYLISLGFFKKKFLYLLLSCLLILLYGTMILGVLPLVPGVSWEGHLFGFLSGIFLAKIDSN